MSNSKPEPIFLSPPRPACPVCGHPSYSLAGIHPQCASYAADKIQTAKSAAKVAARLEQPRLKRHEKRCPKCKTIVHVRRILCNCGCRLLAVKIDS